mgnify:CR=1 FL=1
MIKTTGSIVATIVLILLTVFFPSKLAFALGYLHGLWDRVTGKPYENPGEREDPS